MDLRSHWEDVYRKRLPATLSWYRPHLETSVQLIEQAMPPSGRLIDVGGGAATLVDDLLARGFTNLEVLDLSRHALERARERLGPQAARITWWHADVRDCELPAAAYDLWHDRALFHFLTDAADRDAYLVQLRRALKPGGSAILATFASDGPPRCSGLPVQRYDAAQLAAELGRGFTLVESRAALHCTPAGVPQSFLYCRFRSQAIE
ncbi:MAG: class I SAM-dependent methyltransferase [Gammaproteobacteria bacterium]|nr:class I SAM-dependent methyltransferase [Gammaproteobacteria bacterium]MBV9695429.1 class I SAM-dependent methyltransferase [Gammaproteobacteria bacterium]